MVSMLEKMDDQKLQEHIKIADGFLEKLFGNS